MAAQRPIWLLAPLTLAAGVLAGLCAPPAAAQRPPAIDPAAVEAMIARYATRHVVTALAIPGAAHTTASLRVSNAGWVPANVIAVGLASPPVAPGCEAGPSRVVAVTCLTGLSALASADLAALEGADRALVYSIAGDAAAACAHADALRSGQLTLAAFDADVWAASPGAPLAVAARLASAAGDTARSGVPVTGLVALGLGRPNASLPAAAPFVPPASAVRLVNVGAECARITVRAGRAGDEGPCQLPQPSALEIAPQQAFDLEPAGNAPVVGYGARGEVVSSVAWADAGGAATYDGQPQGAEGAGILAFPVAVTPLTNPRAELWVTNQAPTATTQIALLMWDGNLAQHRIYNDPEPLCPGATRRYDIVALAGTIPPTRNRAGTEGPPVLSVRVESLNAEVATAPPIAGVMVVGGDEGMEAYSGVQNTTEMALAGRFLRQRQDQPGGLVGYAPTNVVPNVMFRHGPDQLTTFLAIQALGIGGGAENQAVIDLYDSGGALVLAGARAQMGAGPGAVVDLGRIGPRAGSDRGLPPGFFGTAVVRGAQGRGALGVVAFTRPLRAAGAPAAGDALTVLVAPPLLRGPDPNAPTPSPVPTRPTRMPTEPVSPTPGGDATATPALRLTPTPDGGEPTPTARWDAVARIVLPWGERP